MPSPADPFAAPPRHEGTDAPVFIEAWHAQVLALAHALTQSGMFTAGEWSNALGAALRRLEGSVDDEEQLYYNAALEALESLVDTGGNVGPQEYQARIEAWRKAYLETPHGQPVELPKD